MGKLGGGGVVATQHRWLGSGKATLNRQLKQVRERASQTAGINHKNKKSLRKED